MAKGKLKTHGVVKLDNNLIDAKLNLSAQGKKIVLFTAKILQDNEVKVTSDTVTVSTTVTALANFLGVSSDSYRFIRTNLQELQKTLITLHKPHSVVDLVLMYRSEYFEDGRVELTFAKDLQPLFADMKEKYTGLLLGEVLRLRSKYSLRVYELCMMLHNRDYKRKEYTLKELKELWGIPPKHNWGQIVTRVLDPAKKELDEKCKISFEYQAKAPMNGVGRPRVKSVIIDVVQNKPQPSLF
jgi:plasmid replication initiation protein